MPKTAVFALDLLAIALLTFALYFPRHRRRDLVVSYLGVNVGVLAVVEALISSEVTAGLGLGLFGVLSIIRLRSFELDQQEVAYYFVALALGVLGGVPIEPAWLSPALMAALLATVFVGDHPRLFGRYRVESLVLDEAYTDERLLVRRLESMLGARVHGVAVRRVDLVQDTTNVEVRFELPPGDGRDDLSEGSPRRESVR
ncbi:MAG TPA: DUF4956 domain-containing protein [Iamia sp.]